MAIGMTNARAKSGSPPIPTSGDHKVIFIDPFGVLSEQWVNDGEDAIVPTPKEYDNLTFTEWNQSYENITEDRVIGGTYSTTDGKSYAKIRLTTVSGLSPTLYLNKSDGSTLTVDWGDGNTSTFTNSGIFNTGAHNYSVAGDYVITMWISSGSGTYGFGNSNSSTTFVGGSTQTYRDTLLSLFIGNSVTSIGMNAFNSCYSLTSISIPNSVTSIGPNAFSSCYSLTSISIPNSVTSIGGSAFNSCYSLTSISISNSVTSIGTNAFSSCYSLTSISIPNSVTSIGYGAFPLCYSLTNVSIPNSVTSIGNYAFQKCYSILEYKIYATTPPTLASTNAFSGINSICKIYVPDASVTDYQTATNWSTYADYIYPLSDIE